MIKKLLSFLGALVGLLVVVFAVQLVASETGEVVVLRTSDEAGAEKLTRLWVVDHQGAQYLRAGAGESSWYLALLANPEVHVERRGVDGSYTAVPAPEEREAVNSLMGAKYGWRESFIGVLVGGRASAMPIRLDPAG